MVHLQKIFFNRALALLYNFLSSNDFSKYHILLPTNICHDVYFLILFTKIDFSFLDIDLNTLEIDLSETVKNIEKKKNVILLWNHTYGNPKVPYNLFKKIKDDFPATVIIDDRCLCDPTDYERKKEDCLIDLILYSTGYAKQVELNYGAFGFVQKKYMIEPKYYDFNKDEYNLTKKLFSENKFSKSTIIKKNIWEPLNLTYAKKKYFQDILYEKNKWQNHKNKIKVLYEQKLKPNLIFESKFNNWRYNILVDNKDEILKSLFNNKLFASNHYPSIGTRIKLGRFPNAEWLHSKVINLFFDKYYSEKKALNSISIINKYAKPVQLTFRNLGKIGS